MKFLDANVIIYAFFASSRKLQHSELSLKENCRKIIERIESGEEVAISVVHLSEVANVLKICFTTFDLAQLLESFYTKENVHIISISQQDYLSAIHLSKISGQKINDCLLVVIMNNHHAKEVYTFDKDFNNFKNIKVIHS